MFVQSHLLCDTGIWAQLWLLDSDMHGLSGILVWLDREALLHLIKLLAGQGALELRNTGWLGHSDDLTDLLSWVRSQLLEAAPLIWAARGTLDNDLWVHHGTCVNLGVLGLVVTGVRIDVMRF